MLKLIRPTIEYKKEYIAAEKESVRKGEAKPSAVEKLNKNFKTFVDRMLGYAEGKRLRKKWVPWTTYWLVDGKKFIGETTIRHRLTPALRMEGGHIGYGIRPSRRKKGYGIKILKLALNKAKGLGIKRALITCNDSNIGSWKIIEANGGILKEKIRYRGKIKRHYWIKIK